MDAARRVAFPPPVGLGPLAQDPGTAPSNLGRCPRLSGNVLGSAASNPWARRQAEAETKRLEGLNGAAFDRAYAEHELANHRQVNDAVRSTLIPAASDPELKNLLQTGLGIFEGHQQHAERLVRELR